MKRKALKLVRITCLQFAEETITFLKVDKFEKDKVSLSIKNVISHFL